MTVDEVTAAVARIERMKGDDEAAHCAEDALNRKVLAAIASGAAHAGELAEEALKAWDIDFCRWCA